MTYDELIQVVSEIELGFDCELTLKTDLVGGSRHYFQIRCWRKDTITGEMGYGYGGKAYLSRHAVRSEVVATAFGLYKAYLEHETRESFKWRGRRVYGPHIDVVALHAAAANIEVRPQPIRPPLGVGHGVEA